METDHCFKPKSPVLTKLAVFVWCLNIDDILLLSVAAPDATGVGQGSEQKDQGREKHLTFIEHCHAPGPSRHRIYIVPHNLYKSAGNRSSCISLLRWLKRFRNLTKAHD